MGAAGAAAKAAGKGMSNRSLGIDALWEDEVEELLTASELRCQSCGRKYQKGLLFCPNCNEVVVGWLVWLRRMGWLVVITLSVLAFLNYRRLYPPAPTGADGGPQKGGVEMLGHSLKREKYGRLSYIRGVVTNHSPVDFFYVKVEFDLLDAKGRRLGTVSDQRSVMSSNAVWNYKALVLDPDGARYENPRVSAVR